MQLIDITPEVSSSLATFPGDIAFNLNYSKDTRKGNSYSLSSFSGTTHLGAHADSPIHYSNSAQTIESRDLNYYIGKCQVVDVSNGPLEISLHSINNIEIKATRILFKSNSIANVNKWQDDFAFITAEVVTHLANLKVVTIGIDTPSIDPSASKTLAAHQAISVNDMAILEGLDLSSVNKGLYELIALPLKLKGADASPVRAVLRTI